jgi:hypothetical protein
VDVEQVLKERITTQQVKGSNEVCWTATILCPFSTDMILMVAVTKATLVWEVLDYMGEAGAILDGERAETTLMLGNKELSSTKTLGAYGVEDLGGSGHHPDVIAKLQANGGNLLGGKRQRLWSMH